MLQIAGATLYNRKSLCVTVIACHIAFVNTIGTAGLNMPLDTCATLQIIMPVVLSQTMLCIWHSFISAMTTAKEIALYRTCI